MRVLPDIPAVRKTFDYVVPASLDERVRIGTQVRVTLHGRRVNAWVVETDVFSPEGVVPLPIDSVTGWGPPSSIISLSQWAAWRWAGPVTAFMKAASAKRSVATLPTLSTRGTARPAGAAPVVPDREREPWAEAFSGGTVVVCARPAVDLHPFAEIGAGLLRGALEESGVLVLAPERREAARTAARLSGSGFAVALLPEDWPMARRGGCVVVGTRSAALSPLPRLAAAVVLDAHDEAYQEQRSPTWCAWELVAERARRDGAPCALVSPCPTLELLAAGRLVSLSRGAAREGWPALEIVDRRDDDPRTGLYSHRVVSLVRWAAESPGRRVLCVLNRKGRARLLACASCREIARCELCRGPMELAEDDGARRLRCRRCGEERPVVCLRCGAGRVRTLRIGVSRAREELEALARVPVTEVSGAERGRSSGKGAGLVHQELGAPVVVGTEAVLHRAGSADAVVFLDFDSELLAPRMRAAEESLALLVRASRLVAGSVAWTAPPGRARGRVLVQTRLPGHEVLAAAVSADPGRLWEVERPVRQALRLPPFGALAVLSGAGADAYGTALREAASPDVEVTGPVDGRWSVRADGHLQLCDLLAEVSRPPGRLRVEIDPVRV